MRLKRIRKWSWTWFELRPYGSSLDVMRVWHAFYRKKICLRYVTICYLFDWYDCICQCGNAVPSVFLYVCVCVCPCVCVCVCVFYQDKWQVFYIPGISTKFPVWIANGTLENRLTVDLSIIFRIILPDPCDTGVGLIGVLISSFTVI